MHLAYLFQGSEKWIRQIAPQSFLQFSSPNRDLMFVEANAHLARPVRDGMFHFYIENIPSLTGRVSIFNPVSKDIKSLTGLITTIWEQVQFVIKAVKEPRSLSPGFLLRARKTPRTPHQFPLRGKQCSVIRIAIALFD